MRRKGEGGREGGGGDLQETASLIPHGCWLICSTKQETRRREGGREGQIYTHIHYRKARREGGRTYRKRH